MFFGEYEHSLDEKGRVTIPAGFREQLHGEVFVTRGPRRQLLVFPKDTWQQLVPKIRRESLSGDVPRVLFSGSMVPIDRHGRILLPPGLRGFCALQPGDQAILNGVAEHMEIWSADGWSGAMDEAMQEAQLTDELRKLGL